jgi:signal transduction histidine kinase
MSTDLEIDSLAGQGVARKAYAGAMLACLLVLLAGALVVQKQVQLARLAHVAIDQDAVYSLWANRAAASALQCRRYEKDAFLNLNDEPTRSDYVNKWTQAWEKLKGDMDHLQAGCLLPEEKQKGEACLAAARRYRQRFLEVVALICDGKIVRPEDANRAITPFKDDVRAIIVETAAFADIKVTQACQSAQRLTQSVLLNVIATCLLAIIPTAVIIFWTNWLTRQIVVRNDRLARLYRELDARHQSLDAANQELSAEIQRADRLAAEAQEAAQAKSAFLANISHELRTPLHGILSYSRFGLNEAGTAEREELHDFFQNVSHCADNLLHLVNDLLDLSKLEAGRMNFDVRPTDLSEVVEVVIDEFKSLCSEQRVAICYEKPAGAIQASVDPDRIQQVIRNLLSNAVKFSPPEGTIRVRLCQEDKLLLLSVRDEGPGIPPDELEAVFDKFVQSSKTKSNTGGTGLGLAICREIVSGHEGRIWAENNPGAGCSFYCALPRANPETISCGTAQEATV